MSETPVSDSDAEANQRPVGTFALLILIGIGMVLGWLFLYFGVFLPRGAVH